MSEPAFRVHYPTSTNPLNSFRLLIDLNKLHAWAMYSKYGPNFSRRALPPSPNKEAFSCNFAASSSSFSSQLNSTRRDEGTFVAWQPEHPGISDCFLLFFFFNARLRVIIFSLLIFDCVWRANVCSYVCGDTTPVA